MASLRLTETGAKHGLDSARKSLAISRKNLGHSTASLSLTRSRANLGHSTKRRRSKTQLLGLQIVNLGLLRPPSTSLPSSCLVACSTCHNTCKKGGGFSRKKRPGFADWGPDISAGGPLNETLLAWIPFRKLEALPTELDRPIPFARTRT